MNCKGILFCNISHINKYQTQCAIRLDTEVYIRISCITITLSFNKKRKYISNDEAQRGFALIQQVPVWRTIPINIAMDKGNDNKIVKI